MGITKEGFGTEDKFYGLLRLLVALATKQTLNVTFTPSFLPRSATELEGQVPSTVTSRYNRYCGWQSWTSEVPPFRLCTRPNRSVHNPHYFSTLCTYVPSIETSDSPVQARRITDSTHFNPKRFSDPKVLKFYKGAAWAFLAVLLAEVSVGKSDFAGRPIC